jgi:hypothetical protein
MSESDNVGAKFGFVVHAAELDSSPMSDSDSNFGEIDSLLCDTPAMTDFIPLSPLSFDFTCSADLQHEGEARLQEVNIKWNDSYADTPVNSTTQKVNNNVENK